MNKNRLTIGVIETSEIVFEGLSNILLQSDFYGMIKRLNDPAELENPILKDDFDIIILNPSVVQNKLKEFKRIKKNKPSICWFGVLYSFFDNDTLSQFDDTFSIIDPPEKILSIISYIEEKTNGTSLERNTETLSERETDVLKQLINGLSNKEIADHLNISVHTVMSHRKNITQKTGIKSQSGLTIYAITQKIVSLNNLPAYE